MGNSSDNNGSRRTFIKTVGVIGMAGGLAGCTGSSSNGSSSNGSSSNGSSSNGSSNAGLPDLSGTKVHVAIDETSSPIQEFWKGIVSSFKQETNANIDIEFVGRNTSGVQRVTQLLQAGDPPELFVMPQDNATQFHTQGALEPVTDTVKSIEERLGTAPAHVKFDGEQWTVPLFFNIVSWFWRGDLAEKVGMDKRPDWTWDKAVEYAKKVDNLDNNIHGTYVPAGTGVHSVDRTRAWAQTIGLQIVKNHGGQIEVAFNKGKNRSRMVELLNFLKKRYQYSPVASDSDYTPWARAIPNSVSASDAYIGYRPKMYAIQDNRSFAGDVHVSQMPKKRTRKTDGNIDGLATFKGANVDAAKALMKYALTKERIIDLYKVNPVHDIPPYPKIRNSDAYTNFLDSLPDAYTPKDTKIYQEKIANNFRTSIQEADPTNPLAGTIAGADPLPNLVTAVLINDKNPDDILDKYAEDLQNVLDNTQN